jgi:DNA-nicking Smr family endonuclease
MDFGDILKKWERGQNSGSGKTAIDNHLREKALIDNAENSQRTNPQGNNRRRLLNIKPDAIIDIHGLNSETAWAELERFFENAKNSGYEKVRIVHGKGNHSPGESVLGRTVRQFVEQCSFAGESGYERSANGGSGATWVLLKN